MVEQFDPVKKGGRIELNSNQTEALCTGQATAVQGQNALVRNGIYKFVLRIGERNSSYSNIDIGITA